jgi:hypothetical protein
LHDFQTMRIILRINILNQQICRCARPMPRGEV